MMLDEKPKSKVRESFERIGHLVMNLCCDHEIAKVDCWLTTCCGHFALCHRYARLKGLVYLDENQIRTSRTGDDREFDIGYVRIW